MSTTVDTARTAHRARTRPRCRAATETLLNCYLREGGVWSVVPGGAQPGETHAGFLPLSGGCTTLRAGVRHLSPTLRHRFSTPVTLDGEPVAFEALAAMLVHELGRGPGDGPALERMTASVEAVAAFLEARAARRRPAVERRAAELRRRPSRRCSSGTCCTRRRRAARR